MAVSCHSKEIQELCDFAIGEKKSHITRVEIDLRISYGTVLYVLHEDPRGPETVHSVALDADGVERIAKYLEDNFLLPPSTALRIVPATNDVALVSGDFLLTPRK